jgi:hypothetical protein
MLNYLLEKRNALYWSRLRQKVGKVPTDAIDLGSGAHPRNDFLAKEIWSLDIVESNSPRHVICDASVGELPLDDNSFDLVTAYDFLEHIPRVAILNEKTTFPFIRLMNDFPDTPPWWLFLLIYAGVPQKERISGPDACQHHDQGHAACLFLRAETPGPGLRFFREFHGRHIRVERFPLLLPNAEEYVSQSDLYQLGRTCPKC